MTAYPATVCPTCHNVVGAARFSGSIARLHTHGTIEAGRCTGSGRYVYDRYPTRRWATTEEAATAATEYEARGA